MNKTIMTMCAWVMVLIIVYPDFAELGVFTV